MSEYKIPGDSVQPLKVQNDKEIVLVASGDLRLSANQTCWSAQELMEQKLASAFSSEGISIIRGHAYDPIEKHGFISTQRQGMNIFNKIPKDARLIVAEAVWQYSYHVLAGLKDHHGPILTVGNWNGEFPGLVGLLNLNASLSKMGVEYSTIWSEDFSDEFFLSGIRQWLREGKIAHRIDHVRPLNFNDLPHQEIELGRKLAQQLKTKKAILGIFDEGCMGMYNAIIEDNLLNEMGVYKERLSQSALLAEMERVDDEEARDVYQWLIERGMSFDFKPDHEDGLTEEQILVQMKMYIAAVRIAHAFGCDAIGIQYQQGLKDMAPASDLVEGLLNNVDRPPVYVRGTKAELYAGQPVVHFNEVDECAGIDSLITNRVWSSMGFDPAVTLHDIRFGQHYKDDSFDDFIWVFMISGAVPASHIQGGYKGAISKRQPAMFFPRGGGTLSGVCKPGEIVWSRVFIMDGKLHVDLGRATSVSLPEGETQRRLKSTNPEWPIMNAVLHGVTRNQLMARHKSNHLNVAYAPTAEAADKALAAKAAMFSELGVEVFLCGDV